MQDFTVTIPAALLAQQQRTQTIFTYVMVAIAAISLLVGGIGIMNIVLATVMERTREIGIRRAMGARKFDIVRQFLTESVLISLSRRIAGHRLRLLPVLVHRAGRGVEDHRDPRLGRRRLWRFRGGGRVFGIYPAFKARADRSDRSAAVRVGARQAARHEELLSWHFFDPPECSSRPRRCAVPIRLVSGLFPVQRLPGAWHSRTTAPTGPQADAKAPWLGTPAWFRKTFFYDSVHVTLREPTRLRDFVVEGQLNLSLKNYLDLVMANNTDIEIQRLQLEYPKDAIRARLCDL